MRLFPVAVLILILILTSNYEKMAPFNSVNEKEELRNFWWTIFGYNFAEPTKVMNLSSNIRKLLLIYIFI